MTLDTVLAALTSTCPSSFGDLCNGLGPERPDKGDRDGWRVIFQLLDQAEAEGLVDISRARNPTTGREDVDTLQLTQEGADRVRSQLDGRRGLFGAL